MVEAPVENFISKIKANSYTLIIDIRSEVSDN